MIGSVRVARPGHHARGQPRKQEVNLLDARVNQNASTLPMAVASASCTRSCLAGWLRAGSAILGPIRHDLARHCSEPADVCELPTRTPGAVAPLPPSVGPAAPRACPPDDMWSMSQTLTLAAAPPCARPGPHTSRGGWDRGRGGNFSPTYLLPRSHLTAKARDTGPGRGGPSGDTVVATITKRITIKHA